MELLAPKRKIYEIIHSLRSTTMTSAGLTGILALTFYLRLLYFGQIIDSDVGNLGYMAWRMAEGEVLIDLEGPGKPPLYFMLYAAFIRLFGPSVLGLKMFGTIFVLLAVLAVYWIANQAYGKQVGLLAALLFGVFSSGPMIEGGTVTLETVLHFPYILAIGLFLKASESGRLRWYFLTGMCAALATLVKQVGGILFFVFLSYGVYEWVKKQNSSPSKEWPYRYIVLGVGALLPVLGVIIFYYFHGYTLNELYDSMLGSNLHYLQRGYQYTNFLESFFYSLGIILPENGLLWLGTMFTASYLSMKIWCGKGEASDRVLLLWAFWSFAVLWVSGTFYRHYFLQLISPFSVLTAYGILVTWGWAKSLFSLSRFLLQGVWTILLVILVTIFVKTDYKYFFSYTPLEQTLFLHDSPNGTLDGYGAVNVVHQQIAFYIRDHTDPTETIYVWGIAPHLYFLAQRRAATRYRNNYNMSPLFTDNFHRALRTYAHIVMEDITKTPPAYIVQIFPLEDFPELQAFVRARYMVDKDMEVSLPYGIHFYRRRLDIQGIPDRR